MASANTSRAGEPRDLVKRRTCEKHKKAMEGCPKCKPMDDSSDEDEYQERIAELRKMEQMIKERQQKINEFEDTVKRSQADADREIADVEQVLTALTDRIAKCRDDVKKSVNEKLKSTKKKSEDFIKQLKGEIEYLTTRSSEQLSHTEDGSTSDWTAVEVRPPSYVETVRTSLDQLKDSLNEQMKKRLVLEKCKCVFILIHHNTHTTHNTH